MDLTTLESRNNGDTRIWNREREANATDGEKSAFLVRWAWTTNVCKETNITQCLAIQKGKDFIFHKHFIYSILIHTLFTVWGSAACSGLLLVTEDKWAFSIFSQKYCKCVAGLHYVLLLLPQFHITYTWKYSHNLHHLEKSILTISTAAIGIAAFMKTVKENR